MILHLLGIDHRSLKVPEEGALTGFTKPFHKVIRALLA